MPNLGYESFWTPSAARRPRFEGPDYGEAKPLSLISATPRCGVILLARNYLIGSAVGIVECNGKEGCRETQQLFSAPSEASSYFPSCGALENKTPEYEKFLQWFVGFSDGECNFSIPEGILQDP